MRTLKLAVLFFCSTIILGLTSCNVGYERSIKALVDEELNSDLSQYKTVVIIPEAGCTGCISVAEQYFKTNYEDETILFIFTRIISKKSLELRVGGTDRLHRENVVLDVSDKYFLNEYKESIYPYVLPIEDGKIQKAYAL